MMRKFTHRTGAARTTEPSNLPNLVHEYLIFSLETQDTTYIGWSFEHPYDARELADFIGRIPPRHWPEISKRHDGLRFYPWPQWMSLIDGAAFREPLHRLEHSLAAARASFDELLRLSWWTSEKTAVDYHDQYIKALRTGQTALNRIPSGSQEYFSHLVNKIDDITDRHRRITREAELVREAVDGTNLNSTPPEDNSHWGEAL